MARMGDRFEGMSEEERQEAIAQMRERFGGRRREGGMRGGMEDMSEEEREAFRAQMRERFGGRRSQGNGEGGRRRPGGRSDAERQEND